MEAIDDKVCNEINCKHYKDCVCANCDCLEKAYQQGRVDAIAEQMKGEAENGN